MTTNKIPDQTKVFFSFFFVIVVTFNIFYVTQVNASMQLDQQEIMQDRNHELCLFFLQNCFRLKNIMKKNKANLRVVDNKYALFEFSQRIDLHQLKEIIDNSNLSKLDSRYFLQKALSSVNKKSISPLKKKLEKLIANDTIKSYRPITISNGILITFKPKHRKAIEKLFNEYLLENNSSTDTNSKDAVTLQSSKSNRPITGKSKPFLDNSNQLSQLGLDVYSRLSPTIALVDSGVSLNHQEFSQLQSFKQYNPRDDKFGAKDTGFGHGTGVLSLLAAGNQHQRAVSSLPNAKYLSCNGLPVGEYQYLWVISCYDWLIQQDKVDIVINSWLQPSSDCNTELLYPLRALWLANTVPLFSAGNFGQDAVKSRDPVNFPLFADIPLISVGSQAESGEILPSSSFASHNCNKTTSSPTLVAPGEHLIVASPFQADSYQTVSGTSYSVSYVAAALAVLLERFPEIPNIQLVNSLLGTSEIPQGSQNQKNFGAGSINLPKAINKLEEIEGF